MKVVIDRFEGDYAIVELPGGAFLKLAKELIPGGQEGDVVHIRIDKDETKKRKIEIEQLMEDVFK